MYRIVRALAVLFTLLLTATPWPALAELERAVVNVGGSIGCSF